MATEIADYMSWNIQNFSSKHAVKNVFRNLEVVPWIATLIRKMDANVVGIMEVTLGTGAQAVQLLAQELQSQANIAGASETWKSDTSDRNVATTRSVARRADKYALVWDSSKVSLLNQKLSDQIQNISPITFADRLPLSWVMSDINNTYRVDCLLWHAPQPAYHNKAATIQLIADLAVEIAKQSGNKRGLISGDFNYNTNSVSAYAPLTNLGYVGLFNGDPTTLTTLKNFINNLIANEKLVLAGDVDEAFLANAYDNIFLLGASGSDDFKVNIPYEVLQDARNKITVQMVTRLNLQNAMKNALQISDHMPLVVTVSV
ncbi:MAG: hypothetical protein GKS03_17620 [Alphaproteobacteria bacterium]|nr:hypothetical protein [Alphaproteobacteria bacterium]